MSRWRAVLVAVVVLATVAVGACGDDGDDPSSDGGSSNGGRGEETEAPSLDSPEPLSALQFAAVAAGYGARPLAVGETPAMRFGVDEAAVQTYRDALCSGRSLILRVKVLPLHDDLPAYAAVYDEVAARCFVLPSTFNRERGQVVWLVAQNELNQERLFHPDRSAADHFCRALDQTSQITPQLIAAAASEAKLVGGTTGPKLIEIGVSVLITACPRLVAALG